MSRLKFRVFSFFCFSLEAVGRRFVAIFPRDIAKYSPVGPANSFIASRPAEAIAVAAVVPDLAREVLRVF